MSILYTNFIVFEPQIFLSYVPETKNPYFACEKPRLTSLKVSSLWLCGAP